jgi:uncharacterized protein
MGDSDRTIRMIIGTVLILIVLFLTIQPTEIENIVTIILLVIAAILFITAIIGVCPAYMPFRFSTKTEETPSEETPSNEPAPVIAHETGAKYELYKDKAGEFRWRLIASNGQIIAIGGEGYKTRVGAMNGIGSVKKNVTDAIIVEK